jgi:sulfatase maturation enzyme AslB (radical SAM superfamily)
MKIQSLSIVVPTRKCINNCPFCVSKTHESDYDNMISDPLFKEDYIERLEYARDLGTNTIILTGTGEALQNKKFMNDFAYFNKLLKKPFYNIELQTTGVLLDDETLKWLRNIIRVKTISLSVSNLFNNESNLDIINVHDKLKFDLAELSKKIKSYGFNLRISLNILDNIDSELNIGDGDHNVYDFKRLFETLSDMDADQVTFRKMWTSNNDTIIDNWIKSYTEKTDIFLSKLMLYLKKNGRFLSKLPFGALQYSLNEISAVIDDDCMDDKTPDKEELKYLILRENAKLYSKWDDKGSLIF